MSAAYKLPTEPEDAANKRKAAITDALLGAAEVPLETARACAQVAELAATCANKGNTNAVSDAGVAALLADAACRGAVYNVRINVASLEDRSRGSRADRGSEPTPRADEEIRRRGHKRGRAGDWIEGEGRGSRVEGRGSRVEGRG